jgi:protein-L-isoaspartate O-methyltransferase
MSTEEKKPTGTTEKIEGIPLYLIPKAIADQIKKKGEAVFQILVERKFHHRYTVKVESFDEHAERVNQEELAPEEGEGDG